MTTCLQPCPQVGCKDGSHYSGTLLAIPLAPFDTTSRVPKAFVCRCSGPTKASPASYFKGLDFSAFPGGAVKRTGF